MKVFEDVSFDTYLYLYISIFLRIWGRFNNVYSEHDLNLGDPRAPSFLRNFRVVDQDPGSNLWENLVQDPRCPRWAVPKEMRKYICDVHSHIQHYHQLESIDILPRKTWWFNWTYCRCTRSTGQPEGQTRCFPGTDEDELKQWVCTDWFEADCYVKKAWIWSNCLC